MKRSSRNSKRFCFSLARVACLRAVVRSGLCLCGVWLTAATATGCREQRVEYHTRPEFYEKAATTKLPDEVVLDDGTIVRYRTIHKPGIAGLNGGDGSKPFEIREEKPDGTIALHALLPEHVLLNALACVRNQEYQLMYDELLAAHTKIAYEQADQGFPEFAEFFRKNRLELAATLTRMIQGIPAQEVSITNLGNGVTRCSLRPQIADPFKFRTVDIIKEASELKLLMIE